MTRHLRTALLTLLVLPLALAGCSDSSGPGNEIYRATTVEVAGSARPLPAELYSGPVEFSGDTEDYDAIEEVSRATLILERNGSYELNGAYELYYRPASAPSSTEYDLIEIPLYERGTYQRNGSSISFNASEGNSLDFTGTLQNDLLIVDIEDPIFGGSNTFTFER